MRILPTICIALGCCFLALTSFAGKCGNRDCPKPVCEEQSCCGKMGGPSYCDSSAGRIVCNNGYYSDCYCTRHAVMDLQLLQGCCLWKGGVLTTDYTTGAVVCNDGTISIECTLQNLNLSTGIY